MEIFTYPSTTSYTSGDGSVSAMETKVSRPAKREFHPRSQRLACDRLRAAPRGRDTPGHAGSAARAPRRAHAGREQRVPPVP